MKEILTKGTEHTVPALPTFPAKEEGNHFAGWVDKTTGASVKKGDKLTGNVELTPVWMDCGEENHADADTDAVCDECGYILEKKPQPEETTAPAETMAPQETTANPQVDTPSEEKPAKGMPVWAIVVLSVSAAVIAAGVCVLVVVKKK